MLHGPGTVHSQDDRTQPAPEPAARRGVPAWEWGTLAACFAVFVALASFFPRTGDDWAWGSKEGLTWLSDGFQHLNGRYAGNLLAVSLVRTGPLIPVVVAAVVCLLIFLTLSCSGTRTPLGYGLASVLFLAMPLATWRESVVWLSGFVNYAFASAVLLGLFALANAERESRLRTAARGWLVPVAVTGFVGQLFMEHVTLGVCAIGVVLTVLHRRREGAWPPFTLTWTLAALLGAVVMFVNPVYRAAASGTSPYQRLQGSTPGRHDATLAVKVLDVISSYGVVANLALNVVLAVLAVTVVLTRRRARTRAGAAVLLLAAAFLLLAGGLWLVEHHQHLRERERALAAVAVALLVALVATLSTLLAPQRRWTVLTAAGSAIVVTLPLVAVNPVGARCFLPVYLLQIVLVCAVAGELAEHAAPLRRPAAALPLFAAAGLVTALYFSVYIGLHAAFEDRLQQVRDAVAAGRGEVTISPLPHTTWVHNGNPFYSTLKNEYKAYYRLPGDLVLNLEPNPWLRLPGRPAPSPAP